VESRKRARRGTAPSRVAASAKTSEAAFLPSIAALIDDGGQISIGALPPIQCAAVANTDYNCLAMLQRRPAETLRQLLERLDAAIDAPWKPTSSSTKSTRHRRQPKSAEWPGVKTVFPGRLPRGRGMVIEQVVKPLPNAPPNHAFNRTRRHGPSFWQSSMAAGRLTWSC